MTGLGILTTDLCIWADSATQEMVDAAPTMLGHPLVVAKPGSVVDAVPASAGILERINCWVEDHPILAGALVVAGYLALRKK